MVGGIFETTDILKTSPIVPDASKDIEYVKHVEKFYFQNLFCGSKTIRLGNIEEGDDGGDDGGGGGNGDDFSCIITESGDESESGRAKITDIGCYVKELPTDARKYRSWLLQVPATF